MASIVAVSYTHLQLHDVYGKNIGHYLKDEQIFIDMNGRYLGEIVDNNRLLYNRMSSYRGINYGIYGDYGNVGNYGNYGNIGSCSYPGYTDINLGWF